MANSKFKFNPEKQYIAFNKPYAVLCQFTTPEGSAKRTLAEFGFPANVYSVGRLDYDSEGLLILTDDGSLNNALLSPKQKHERTYFICVENIPNDKQIQKLCSGVLIDKKMTLPAKASLLKEEPLLPPRAVPIRKRRFIPTSWLSLTLTEGRNRQVRRMTAAVGCPTLRLVRTSIGTLDLFMLKLEPGMWKKMQEQEVYSLFKHKNEQNMI